MRPPIGETSDTSQASRSWLLLLPLALCLHVAEEWRGGFITWASSTLGVEIEPSRFVWINLVGLVLLSSAVVAAIVFRPLLWMAATVAALLVTNALIHVGLSVAFAVYSPGAITGGLLYLPIGGRALWTLSRVLPRGVLPGSVLAGIALHALATIVAMG